MVARRAHTSKSGSLRAPSTANLADLVQAAEAQVRTADRQYAALQAQVSAIVAHAYRTGRITA